MDIKRLEGATCPDCNGGGVYQEYDEYDRYTVHACATCDGSGEIARQSVTSEEVAEAIEQLKYAREQDREFDDGTFVDTLDLAITALQAYQPWVSVEDEKPESGKHVLLCCEIRPSGKRYVCDGYYAKPKSIIGGDDGECSTEYDEETDEYYLLEGYYEVIKNWGDYSSIAIDDFVVAWKSLPEPPKGG